MIAAIYARKSTEQNGVGDEEKSVTRQIEHAKAYATKKGDSRLRLPRAATSSRFLMGFRRGSGDAARSRQNWRDWRAFDLSPLWSSSSSSGRLTRLDLD
jgi:hypothetical protein